MTGIVQYDYTIYKNKHVTKTIMYIVLTLHASNSICVRNTMSTVQTVAFALHLSAKHLLELKEILGRDQPSREQMEE